MSSITKSQLITAANGFIPVELCMAHLASTYFPADFLHKLNLAMNRPSRFITGVDVKGRQAKRSFNQENFENAADANHFFKEKFEKTLSDFYVQPTFLHTDNTSLDGLRKKTISNLLSSGSVFLASSTSILCNDCDEYLSKSDVHSPSIDLKTGKEVDLKDCSCKLCKGRNLTTLEEQQYFLSLERDEDLGSSLKRNTGKILTKMIDGVWKSDFDRWQFSRNTSYYGAPFPEDENRTLYLWYESLISKFIDIGDASVEDIESQSVKSFFGKNIIQYYSLVFPNIIKHAFGVSEVDLTLCARGFCDIEHSSPSIIDLTKAKQKYDVDELRFYCAYTVNDDVKDFTLTEAGMQHCLKNVLYGAILPYIEKAHSLISNEGIDYSKVKVSGNKIDKIHEMLDRGAPRSVLLFIETLARNGMKMINKGQLDPKDESQISDFLIVSRLMSAYTPNKIEKIIPDIQHIILNTYQDTPDSSNLSVALSQSISPNTP